MRHADILRQIKAAQPHLLLVALGAPKQEKFIRQNLPHWDVPVAIGVGGTLDFLAGVQWRAPLVVQRLGIEWLWRLGTDPLRLLRRYYLNLFFLARVLGQLLFLRLKGLLASEFHYVSSETFKEDFECLGTLLVDLEGLAEVDLADATERWILVDLGRRHWLKSNEIARLVTSARDVRRNSRQLLVLCPSKTLRDFFRVCHLDRFIRLFADAREALCEIQKSFSIGGSG
jgi:N-acetylglucosaminyldiphosphoundecaprenol N-acetyl-beta-D-mannosaminyltransferase